MSTLQNQLEALVVEHGAPDVIDALASAVAIVARAANRPLSLTEELLTQFADQIASDDDCQDDAEAPDDEPAT